MLAIVTGADKLQAWDWERRALVREWDALTGTDRVTPVGFSADETNWSWHAFAQATLRSANGTWRPVVKPAQSTLPAGSKPLPSLSIRRTERSSWRSAPAVRRARCSISRPAVSPRTSSTSSSNGPTFSLDSKLLAVPSNMGHVRVFDSATYRETAVLSGFMFGTHGAGFSPDQQRLAIGSTAFEALTLWDMDSYERLLTLAAPVGALGRRHFRRMATCSPGRVAAARPPARCISGARRRKVAEAGTLCELAVRLAQEKYSEAECFCAKVHLSRRNTGLTRRIGSMS